MGLGICATCKGPTNRTKLALYCIRCAMDRSNEKRRESYIKKPRVRPCDDCGQMLEPRTRRIFCDPCLRKRRYQCHKPFQQKYNDSPKGQATRAAWHERTRAKRLAQMKAYYHAHKKPAAPKKCETLLCENWIPVTRGDRRRFCLSCARVFYGNAYAKRRAA